MRKRQNVRNLALGVVALAAACSSAPLPSFQSYALPTDGTPPGTNNPDDPGSPGSSEGGGGSSGSSGTSGGPTDGGPDPDPTDAAEYATPVQCSTGTHWTQGDQGSDLMQPGSACRTCHVLGGSASKKTWDISGTVYATAHEPNDCNGTPAAGVTVVITDKNGVSTSLPVNAVGNFYHADLFGIAAIPKPYTAKVVQGSKQRVMVSAQTEGDCNTCHSESGASAAPGRIMLP
jgi:hypothetical protein